MDFSQMNKDRVISVLSIIVCVVIAYSANESSRKIAEDSGAFDKANLVALVGTVEVTSNGTTNIIYGYNFSNTDKEVYVIGALPLIIGNNGQKSLDEVTVTFQYHKSLYRSVLEDMTYVEEGGFEVKNAERFFSTMGNEDYASYRIKTLQPGKAAKILDPIILTNNKITTDVELDNGIKFKVDTFFAIKMNISLSARDTQTVNANIEYQAVDVKTKEEFNKYIEQNIIIDKLQKNRESASFFEYLGFLLFHDKQEKLIYIYPENDNSSIDESKFIMTKIGGDIGYVVYKTTGWSYLFEK